VNALAAAKAAEQIVQSFQWVHRRFITASETIEEIKTEQVSAYKEEYQVNAPAGQGPTLPKDMPLLPGQAIPEEFTPPEIVKKEAKPR
jgi:hypothetical protein